MAAVFAFGKRGANNSAPVSNYLISKGFDFDGVKVGFEFLAIMRSAPVLPPLLRPAQRLLVRATVNLIPRSARTILGLKGDGLYPWEAEVVRQAGALADRIVLNSNPAVQACRRMGLPADFLYVRRNALVGSRGPFQQVT